MRIAAFDFGSNSLKCLISDVQTSGIVDLADLRVQNRLASYLEGDVLRPESIPRTLKLLAPVMERCRSLQVQQYLAAGTQALRMATNRAAFVSAIHDATGIRIRILSAAEEAELAWQGVICAMNDPDEQLCVFDSGGASTEFIWGNGNGISDSHSFPLGAVVLHKEFIASDPPSRTGFELLQQAIERRLQYPWPPSGRIIGIGGGVLACAKVALGRQIRKLSLLDGFVLTACELERQIGLYRSMSIPQRRLIKGMEPGRADIILPSALLFYTICNLLGSDGFRISTRGLRHGLLARECEHQRRWLR